MAATVQRTTARVVRTRTDLCTDPMPVSGSAAGRSRAMRPGRSGPGGCGLGRNVFEDGEQAQPSSELVVRSVLVLDGSGYRPLRRATRTCCQGARTEVESQAVRQRRAAEPGHSEPRQTCSCTRRSCGSTAPRSRAESGASARWASPLGEITVHALESIRGQYTVSSVNRALKNVTDFDTGQLCRP